MEALLGIFLGIGLSAACGFRVFVPFLVVSITKMTGHLDVVPGFDWVGTWPALIAFACATGLEILAYYIPVIDNALDTVATPAAAVAGVVATMSAVGDMSPLLEWALGLIGAGVASSVQLSTATLRLTSTGVTAGLGNPIVATSELAGSVATSVVSIIFPVVAAILVVAGAVCVALVFKKKLLART